MAIRLVGLVVFCAVVTTGVSLLLLFSAELCWFGENRIEVGAWLRMAVPALGIFLFAFANCVVQVAAVSVRLPTNVVPKQSIARGRRSNLPSPRPFTPVNSLLMEHSAQRVHRF